jgi:hypothetical protein
MSVLRVLHEEDEDSSFASVFVTVVTAAISLGLFSQNDVVSLLGALLI